VSSKGRDRSQAMREAQEAEKARKKRQRRIINVVGAIVIVGLLAGIGLAVWNAAKGDDEKPASTPTGEVAVPANLQDGAFAVGKGDAPVTLDLHYDYMCPACGAFEATNGEDLSSLIDDGTLIVNLHVLSFLDPQSNGTKYSTRAANAFATVVNGAPDAVWDFHTALYAHQPSEGSDGLTDDEIHQIATDAGVPSDVADTFTDATYNTWVATTTETAFKSGITHTPTVEINGEEFTGDWSKPGELRTAIEAAAN
jgi:protein-disulfide isomerase